ncbi:hypothetical protein JCM10908_006838 [Rhodotorula pacifica]|uniref:heat shock factor-binding 1 family protein n=1 Tax=Rhodotorula pacifica TaxID=1495444 RepID=UPI003178BDFB
MVFSQPLVPSPTLSSSTRTPPLGSSTTTTEPGSPATSKASFTTAQAGGTTVGLGVSGAGELAIRTAEQETEDTVAKAEVTSPLELTQFVDTLLNDLEARFDSLSSDVLTRLNSLSTRVDSLETSLADLMSGSTLPPSSTGTLTASSSTS